MLSSQLYFPTLKEAPSDAELKSHQLMIRAGLIRKLASGLYTWLPLGLRILRKVESIVREEMNHIHAQEVLMPAIQPAELWQETGRWAEYGPHLLKMKDRHQRDFCFGPTHEEVITDLVRDEIKSYKQLPLSLYQIQTKFRDEIRPRFGLMRAREFLMKDAYSFHLEQSSLEKTYQEMYQAYQRIFTRLGLKFRAVLADSGNIGGSQSQEFHVLAESGEDEIAYSTKSEYAANIERATTLPPKTERGEATHDMRIQETPDITTVAEQARFMNLPTQKILKTMLVKGCKPEHPVVALLVRGDHQLNAIKASNHDWVHSPMTLIDVADVERVAGCRPGFVGPIGLGLPLIADRHVMSMDNFSCGANQNDKHYIGVNWQRDLADPMEVCDLRQVQAGDPSPDGEGELAIARGIEVGHIFQLGNKYSKAMDATVLDQHGKTLPLVMGCYGIGISRIVAAAIEQNNDEAGILWPTAMAPFQVAIVPVGYHRQEEVKVAALALYQKLKDANIEVLLDNRNERPGVMFKDMDLIGIPHRVVVSEKGLAKNLYEYRARSASESEDLDLELLLNRINGDQ